MPLITTVSELREFTHDKNANPSGIDPADIVGIDRNRGGHAIHVPSQPSDEPFLLLYGVVMDSTDQPGCGLVSALKAWRHLRELKEAA